MSRRLFCQQQRAHMVPGFHTLARHMDRQPLSAAVVCLLWLGVTLGLSRVHTCVSDHMHVLFVLFFASIFFSSCDSILLDFWAQSAVHMVLCALWMANVSVMVKPMGQDWEVWSAETDWMSVWQMGGGGRQRRCRDSLSRYLLSSVWCFACCRSSGIVRLKCLHSQLIKREKSLLCLNRRAPWHTHTWTQCREVLHLLV